MKNKEAEEMPKDELKEGHLSFSQLNFIFKALGKEVAFVPFSPLDSNYAWEQALMLSNSFSSNLLSLMEDSEVILRCHLSYNLIARGPSEAWDL